MYMTETISKLMEVKFTQSVIDPRIVSLSSMIYHVIYARRSG